MERRTLALLLEDELALVAVVLVLSSPAVLTTLRARNVTGSAVALAGWVGSG